MPRIVPIQLLKCLKVLLDDNGGILSAGEVKRLASLMTKYSKKLVSKCIYVQILKCTKTELLGEFMGAGGWSLVYTWLNDAIRAMNWPLVQEILELLLLCPVDVNRLKINSAPKLVKGLCKDGGNEGVRILAKRLVEQWLKVVTEKNPEAALPNSAASATAASTTTTTASATAAMTPQASTVIKTPPVAVVAPIVTPVNTQQTSTANTIHQISSSVQNKKPQQSSVQNEKNQQVTAVASKEDAEEELEEEEQEDAEEECQEEEEKDPLGDVEEPIVSPTSYGLTPAQKKASESGLVYKIVVKNGNQFLAKVPKPSNGQSTASDNQTNLEDDPEVEAADVFEPDNAEEEDKHIEDNKTAIPDADDNSLSQDKPEKENDGNSGNEDESKSRPKPEDTKKSEDKKSTLEDKEKSSSSKDTKSSKDKERRSSSSGLEKEKDKDKDKDSKTSKSSSSSHRSSNHKSSSSKSSSSSSSKSKPSSSSSSSHRSSSDKHKSDKDRSSSSNKDKDRSGSSSSSSSKHRSSSSKPSGSSSSSSKDKYREKDKSSSGGGSSSSSKGKDRNRDSTTSQSSDKDKANISSSSSSADKLSKILKKPKEENDAESSTKSTSITIPSKKASMSIEIRKDTEKTKTVKTYKSQFRSHGLTEEAPPPPSRKGLKKPPSTPSAGSILPTSLPSSLKRTSPPPRDSPSEKKPKIDINNVTVANEKPGAIKLIPPKKIQTLVETNLFSDALSAATGPKKINKRKRPNTPTSAGGKDGAASPPTSPAIADAPKVAPLKFYQDTLDESKTEESKSDKENEDNSTNKMPSNDEDRNTIDKDNDIDDDDDDIPLKKVKEDIEQKVAQEKKMDAVVDDSNVIDITKDVEEKDDTKSVTPGSPSEESASDTASEIPEVKKPGPGCGPNGPPGVLMLHRRKGPKKKLTWRPQDTLEQVRYFELDENERCNVTKTSFMDMKNLERSNERDAVVLARRGFNQEDNMEPTTHWRPLIEVDDVPPHPEGNQSKQRKIQTEREMTTLRALYFTHALIPDSPAEAEIEPTFSHDIPLIPLDDLTGNPDAVNDFTSMPWPEPRGSPKYGDGSITAGTGGLGSPVDIFGGGPSPQMMTSPRANNGGAVVGGESSAGTAFNPFITPFSGNQGGPNGPGGNAMPSRPQGNWQRPPNGMSGNGSMMGNQFVGSHGSSPIMDMMGGGGPRAMGGGGGPGPVHMMNNIPQQNFNNQNFNNQFSPNNNHFGPPINPFGGNNFGPMGPAGPMIPPHMMNGMGPGPMMGNNGPSMMNGPGNNRNNGGNWRSAGPNFQDNNGGGGGGNWRPAGTGPNRGGNVAGGGGNNNNNSGICKAFMRGHCRVGKSCKYIHPSKSKRI